MERFTDDTVVALASFLSPHDMLNLALSCKRFGDKHGNKKQSADRGEGMRNVRQRIDTVSLMEVAARTVLYSKWTDEEKNALPRRGEETWIGLYQEFLKLFHYPIQFDKLVGTSIAYLDRNDKTKAYSMSHGGRYSGVAICSNIMRAGRHCVSFNFDNPTRSEGISCGIMRPTRKDITSLTSCHPLIHDLSSFSLKDYETLYGGANVDCCLLNTYKGKGFLRERWRKWEGSVLMAMDEEHRLQAKMQNLLQNASQQMEPTQETASFKIGFILDLDEGTLDVYKNDRCIGTMMRGLIGEYCWVVSLRPEYDIGAPKTVAINR